MSIVLLAAYLSLAIWVYLLLARGNFWRADVRVGTPVTAAEWPDITVIIPARNEADILRETLPTLLSNDYPHPLRVVLVDDRSEDETASAAIRIADQSGASDRLIVVNGRPLPAGWKGKVWAMQCGLETISAMGNAPSYILFTDADIAYDKDALTALVSQAEAGKYVLASLMVKLRCQSMAERFLIPAFVYFFQMLYPFAWVNETGHKMAAAAGGAMLLRYDALQKAGGLESIRGSLIDDCALARLMKKQGSIWLGLTEKVHSIRPYPHLKDIHSMVTRSAYDQLDYSPLKLFVAVSGLLITFVVPVLLALFATGVAQLSGVVCWAMMALSFFPVLHLYRRSPLLSPCLPVIALFYMGFTLDSAYQFVRGKGGVWKGRIQAINPQRA